MKLLVVEDDHRILANLKKGLELHHHVVDTADDGLKGLDLASSEDYDVIVLDRMLPGMDGVAVCQQLRQQKKVTPILMLTAKTLVNDRVEGLDAGADDYLGKPFAFSELLARIRALGRRPQTEPTQKLHVDSLELDPNTVSVTRNHQPVQLSKTEYSLLEFLMKHPGQVFSADQLVERVWEFESDILPNTVQVYIGYLRQKIDKAFPKEKKLIHTVRGFGYKLEASTE